MAEKVRIRIRSFDSRLLDRFAKQLFGIAMKNDVKMSAIPLPMKIEKYIVNKSPHKDKKAREQFGIKTHTRLILLSNFDNHSIFMGAQLPPGVEAEILVV